MSFKLGKTRTKYRPKSVRVSKPPSAATDHGVKTTDEAPDSPGSKRKRTEVMLSKVSSDRIALSLSSTSSEGSPVISEHESSFAVNLLLDGFSIGKPTEKGKQPPSAQELTASVHPYDRTTETLFQAIDGGWLPGDIHEDMPCKYVDGCVICEVRDYRKGSPISGDSVSSGESFPMVQKVLLRPTMENIVKDIVSMAEDSWTYSDLIEIESRILKAVRPKLCLDPTPMLERLCENPNLNKLNLGVPMTRRQRMQKGGLPQVRVSSNIHSKKVTIDKATENTKSLSGTTATTSMFEDSGVSCIKESSAPAFAGVASNIPGVNSKLQSNVQSGQDLSRFGPQTHSSSTQTGLNRSRPLHGQGNQISSSVNTMSFASGSFQDWGNTFMDPRIAGGSVLGKRDNVSMLNKTEMKKQKQELACMEKFQQQNTVPKLDTTLTKDAQRKDKLVPQDQNSETVHFSDVSAQRHSQQLTGDDDQQVTSKEVSLHEPKLSPHLDQMSTGEFKVKEEIDFERGQIGIEQESEEVERNKESQHLMELDNEQPDQKQIKSQHFPQQPGKQSFQWHNVVQPGQKDQKRDDLLQKTKSVQSPREILRSGGALQSQSLSNAGEQSQSGTSAAVPTSFGQSYNNMTAAVSLGQQREKPLGLATACTSVTGINSSQPDSQYQQVQSSSPFGRRRSNSLGVASPGSVTNSMTQSNVNSPSTGTAPLPSSNIKMEPVVHSGQNKHLETVSKLVSVIQRHGAATTRKKKVEEFPEKKQSSYWLLLLKALNNDANNDDQQDVTGQRSMASSLVGGGVNVRKTRIINFEGAPLMPRRNRVRLVMCERAKDGMVEAVVQFGDDQEDDSSNSIPHDILPLLPNTHYADMLAMQFCALMVKDGYKLTEDHVQPIQSRSNVPQNASSIVQSMAPSGSTLGGNINQLPSSLHLITSQNMPSSASVCGIPSLNTLQLSSPSTLTAVQMPPPGNTPNRQLSSGFLPNGLSTSSKALQHDTSQLAVVQQQQQHQMQQHPPQVQRSQQLVTASHLPQLNAASHSSNQQINMSHPNPLQHLMLQNQQRQQQQQQHQQFQRKMMLSPGMNSFASMGVGNISGVNSMSGVGMPISGGPQGGLANMGLSGMNSVVGMGGINGISTSMGGISGLTNIGQHSGMGNVMGHNFRSGTMNPQAVAAALTAKSRMQGRGRPGPIANPSINMQGISVGNQTHNSVGLSMLGQSQGRGNMSSLQRASGTGMGPPKIVTSGMGGVPGQSLYLNQQLSNQSQQINSQQQLNQQPQLNVQQQMNLPQPPSSQQPLSSQPLLNVQHQPQINQQQQLNSQSQLNSQQQLNPQQLNSQPQLNPQQMGAGNLVSVGGPTSPQLSSQTLGSVGSITSSPMELQSANRGNSMGTGQ